MRAWAGACSKVAPGGSGSESVGGRDPNVTMRRSGTRARAWPIAASVVSTPLKGTSEYMNPTVGAGRLSRGGAVKTARSTP
ncbi:MAG: hypothetical protein R3B49_02955 [Phycisphaerales bacterium]